MTDLATQELLHITQSLDGILKEHSKRTRIQHLLDFSSNKRRVKECREKLQSVVEILRVRSRRTTRIDSINDGITSPTPVQEMEDQQNLQLYDASSSCANPNSDSNDAFCVQDQAPQRQVTAGLGHHFIARTSSTYIQDNSLAVNGSGNNITVIVYGSH